MSGQSTSLWILKNAERMIPSKCRYYRTIVDSLKIMTGVNALKTVDIELFIFLH